ncbi:MAG: hypothetical protein GX242_06310 [Clostridiales bacterium]|mgnify:CR=1 FL=1|jgi:predicted membrane protein|nr:hypothetical protein [Clostridiales bacterium]
MKELKCLPIDYKKLALRSLLDFLIIAVLLFLIAFMESFIKDFTNSFSYIFREKLPLFFVMMALSVILALLISVMEVRSHCKIVKFDDQKIAFVKSKKEESMELNANLFVQIDAKNDKIRFSFRQNKRVVNAFLLKSEGSELMEFLRQKEIKTNGYYLNDKKENLPED